MSDEDEFHGGFDVLIEAFQIFKKYANPSFPTTCEHDQLFVIVDPGMVSSNDLDRLKKLGFIANQTDENFYSYRFGSC